MLQNKIPTTTRNQTVCRILTILCFYCLLWVAHFCLNLPVEEQILTAIYATTNAMYLISFLTKSFRGKVAMQQQNQTRPWWLFSIWKVPVSFKVCSSGGRPRQKNGAWECLADRKTICTTIPFISSFALGRLRPLRHNGLEAAAQVQSPGAKMGPANWVSCKLQLVTRAAPSVGRVSNVDNFQELGA